MSKLKLKINHEYKKLLPKLTEEQYLSLKQSIQKNGQYYPIIHNEDGVILDGHTRNQICVELGITPKAEKRTFKNKFQEKKFVITANLQRRHLTTIQKAKMALALLPIEKELAMERQGTRTDLETNIPQEVVESKKPREGEAIVSAAKQAGISGETLRQYEIIQESAPEELKEKVSEGGISISSAYKELKDKEAEEKLQEKKTEIEQEKNGEEEKQLKEIKERFEKVAKETVKILQSPEVQERGAMFKNWLAHGHISDVLGTIHCPNDPVSEWGPDDWKKLQWSCCGQNIEESLLILKEKLEKSIKSKNKLEVDGGDK